MNDMRWQQLVKQQTEQARIFRQQLEARGITVEIDLDAPPAEQLTEIQNTVLRHLDRDRELSASAQAEEAERPWERVFDVVQFGLAYVSAQSNTFLMVNSAFAQQRGYTPDELVGRSILTIYPPEIRQAAMAHLREADRTGHTVFESVHLRKDGTRFPVLIELTVITDAQGTPISRIAYALDETERVRLEESRLQALQQAKTGQRMLEALMEYVPMGITIADAPDLTIRMVSRYGINLLGGSHQGMTAAQVAEQWTVFHGDGVTPMATEDLPLVRAILRGEVITNIEIVETNARGDRLWLLCNAGPILGPNDEITGGVVAWNDITERQRVTAALQESETRLALFIENAPAAIAMFDEDMRYLVASRRWLIEYGLEGQHVIGKSHYTFFRNLPSEWIAAHQRGLAGEIVRANEDRYVQNDTIKWLRWEVRPWHKTDGTVGGIILFTEDITELKNVEEQLQRRNRALRLLSDVNQALIRATAENTLLQRICQIAVEAGGYRFAWVGYVEHDKEKTVRPVAYAGEDQSYLTARHFSWDEDMPAGQGPLGQAIRARQPVYADDLQTAPNFAPWRDNALARGYRSAIVLPISINTDVFGALILYRAEPYHFSEDERKLLVEMTDDLAFGIATLRSREARAKAENALTRERLLLSTAIDILPFPVFFLTAEGSHFRRNRATDKLFEAFMRPGEDFRTVMHVLDPVTRVPIPYDRWPESRALQGETVSAEEYLLQLPDGRELSALVQAAPIRIDDRVIAVVIAIQDVTPIKEADRAKNQFLAILSHELRTPLTNILGWAREAEGLPEIVPQALQVIIHNAESQRHLLENLLEISRVLYGKLVLQQITVDLWAVTRQAVNDLVMATGTHRLAIEHETSTGPLPVLGDHKRLLEAITTLLAVVLEVSEPESLVHIRGMRRGVDAIIEVISAGHPIAAEDIPRLLDIFQITPETVQIGGVGVRLALVRTLIEAHGGRVRISTTPGGGGNLFAIILPFRAEERTIV